jgi:hypothetical protein
MNLPKDDFVLFGSAKRRTTPSNKSKKSSAPVAEDAVDLADSDAWDDSLLIRAFDEAVAEHRSSASAQKATRSARAPPKQHTPLPVLPTSVRTGGKTTKAAKFAASHLTPAAASASSAQKRRRTTPTPSAAVPHYAGFTPTAAVSPYAFGAAAFASSPFSAYAGMPFADWNQMQQQFLMMQAAQAQQQAYASQYWQQAFALQQQPQQALDEEYDDDYDAAAAAQDDGDDDEDGDGDGEDDDDDDDDNAEQDESVVDDAALKAMVASANPTPPEQLQRIEDEELRALLIAWYQVGFKSGYHHCATGKPLDF